MKSNQSYACVISYYIFRFVSFRFVSWNTVSPFNAIYMGNQMANYGGRYIKFEFGETFETTVALKSRVNVELSSTRR